ncbi:MAG: hypothetical protein K6A79_06735 [Ruminococcus sp.]|nr:hypothetical protein [Ruminococcus sp.]
MKKTNNNAPMKRIAASATMLAVSAAMLGTSTYAWFTMNKEVTVTGMELKAHSEEGLLINEVKLATSNTWDDAAQAAATPTCFELRPTSTSDLATWWHANSKKSADEAGIDAKTDTVSVGNNGEIYTNLSTATDQTIIGAEGAESGAKATGNTQAETHVFYTDASYGTANSYQNGEGYYVRYTYYLKSSGQADFAVTDLQAKVKATKKDSTAATNKLDPALRVGIAVPASNAANAAIAGRAIFSPIPGSETLGATNTSYGVTDDVKGGENTTVTPTVASEIGTYTAYQTLNLTTGTGQQATTSTITIPKVTSDGIPVYVYVWFEGEDTHCMSDNLTATLNAYDIDITFNNNNIGGSGTPANNNG